MVVGPISTFVDVWEKNWPEQPDRAKTVLQPGHPKAETCGWFLITGCLPHVFVNHHELRYRLTCAGATSLVAHKALKMF